MAEDQSVFNSVGETGFRGKINDIIYVPFKGLVLSLTEIEGIPQVGGMVRFAQEYRKVLELGRNSTDGQTVSTRSCLTGLSCAPYGSIAIEWDGPRPEGLTGEWVTSEGL